MENIDNTRCMSVKSKGSNIQCTALKKNGFDYCGVHLRAKHLVRIDSIIGTSLPTSESKPKLIIFKNSNKNNTDLYTYHDLQKIKKINYTILKNTCIKYNVDFTDNDIEKTFNNLKQIINKIIEPYLKYEKQIITIQKTFKMFNIYRRNKSNNKEDCGTLDSIYDIPIEYYIDYQDCDGFTYAFDIRTLELINKNNKQINPYTQKIFSRNNNFLIKLKQKIEKIKEKNGKINYDSPKLTEEQRYHQFLIRVFQKYDMIGQYTDIVWFELMDLNDLKKFYRNANDMFAFRAQLSRETKKKIVKDGILFSNFLNNLHSFKEKNKRLLQFEILREMERIVDEGYDKEYKILGVNLILTVFVEICPAAALALPHLVQSSFG